MNGHDLAEEIIRKHGVDRYPTVELTLIKLQEEIGEFIHEYLREKDIHKMAKEYADTGICLYRLGSILNLDLIEEMCNVVNKETRKFA